MRFQLLDLILADLPPSSDRQWLMMAISHSYSESSYWQRYILPFILLDLPVRVHMGRSTGRSTPPVVASSGQQWQFHIHIV